MAFILLSSSLAEEEIFFDLRDVLIAEFALGQFAVEADGGHTGAEIVVHIGADPVPFFLLCLDDGDLCFEFFFLASIFRASVP